MCQSGQKDKPRSCVALTGSRHGAWFTFVPGGLNTPAWWLRPARDAPIHLARGHELSWCRNCLLISGPHFVQVQRKIDFARARQPLSFEDAFQIGWAEMAWTIARGASSFSLVAVVDRRTAE